MRKLLSTREVASLLDVTEQTLANWRYLGKGPRYYRVGHIKYDERDVEAWLESCAIDASPSAA